MTISTPRHRTFALLGAAFAIAVPGCGDDDGGGSATPAASPASAAVAAGPVLTGRPDAGSLTCSHLANRENHVVVYDASLELARKSRLSDNTRQVATRIYAAMHDLCDDSDDPGYRPAKDSLAAVERGEYEAEVSLP